MQSFYNNQPCWRHHPRPHWEVLFAKSRLLIAVQLKFVSEVEQKETKLAAPRGQESAI